MVKKILSLIILVIFLAGAGFLFILEFGDYFSLFLKPQVMFKKNFSELRVLKNEDGENLFSKIEPLGAYARRNAQLYFPNGKGLGQGGTPMFLVKIPGSEKIVGIYSRDPSTSQGAIFDAQKNIVMPINLQGPTPSNVMDISMPTAKVLLLDGLFDQDLYQFDLQNQKIVGAVTNNYYGRHHTFSFNPNIGLVIYYDRKLNAGINREIPSFSVVRLYTPAYPLGIDLLRVNYTIGKIDKIYWPEESTLYFSTVNDVLSFQKERFWKLKFSSKLFGDNV